MTIKRNTTLISAMKDPVTGRFKTLTAQLTFTDTDKPGVDSSHMAQIPIGGINGLPATAVDADFHAAIDKWYSLVKYDIETFHSNQLDYLYASKNGNVVNLKPVVVTSDMVDAERDRRISSGFTFNGVRYQSRDSDRENIAGASTAALAAIMNGAKEGDYFWSNSETSFAWIAEDNTIHPMDAQTMFAFGTAAMEHKQKMIFIARSLKDMNPIPENYTDDSWWI